MPLTSMRVVEQGHVRVPLSYVFQGTDLDLLPEVTSGKYVTVRLLRDSLDVRANKYVGYIPLNSRYVLHVVPKFALRNLLTLLAEGKGDSHALDFFERSYDGVFDPDRTLIDFLANCLTLELDTLAREGMWRGYLPEPVASPFPSGRLLPAATMLQSWAHGDLETVHSERFEFRKDTAVNRLIKYAVWLLASYLASYDVVGVETIRSLSEHLRRFDGVKLDRSLSFLTAVEKQVHQKAFPSNRTYYFRLCRISLYVLQSVGLDILSSGTESPLPSFVIDLESAFERYILRTLQEEIPRILTQGRVLDGNREGIRELFTNRRGYPMTPDCVVEKDGRPLLIADVKYKAKPEREDRSQVITYAIAYGVTHCLLICPSSTKERHGRRPVGKVNDQIQVDEYYFDLAAENLASENRKLARSILEIIRAG